MKNVKIEGASVKEKIGTAFFILFVNFDRTAFRDLKMTTLTINIDNKKTEKAIKAILDMLNVEYRIDRDVNKSTGGDEGLPLNKREQAMYGRLKKSFQQIDLHREGKIELPDARNLLDEL